MKPRVVMLDLAVTKMNLLQTCSDSHTHTETQILPVIALMLEGSKDCRRILLSAGAKYVPNKTISMSGPHSSLLRIGGKSSGDWLHHGSRVAGTGTCRRGS
jgi:chemotaxis response regulator CheB